MSIFHTANITTDDVGGLVDFTNTLAREQGQISGGEKVVFLSNYANTLPQELVSTEITPDTFLDYLQKKLTPADSLVVHTGGRTGDLVIQSILKMPENSMRFKLIVFSRPFKFPAQGGGKK